MIGRYAGPLKGKGNIHTGRWNSGLGKFHIRIQGFDGTLVEASAALRSLFSRFILSSCFTRSSIERTRSGALLPKLLE